MASREYTDSWSSGILGCCSDGGSCCTTWFCPCVTYGKNVSSLHEEESFGKNCCFYVLFAGVGCVCCSYQQRFFLRQKYGLPEEPCTDCCTHFWCHPCALCQEAREIKNRNALINS